MPDHVQLDPPIVLPNVPDPEDACVDRLTTGEDAIRDVLRSMDVQLRGDVLDVRGPAVEETATADKDEGRTTMIVRRGEDYLGVIGPADQPREGAAGVIERLRQIGIRRMAVISGDNQRVVDAVAEELGLQIGPAVVLHEGSTLGVAFNALQSFRGDTLTS